MCILLCKETHQIFVPSELEFEVMFGSLNDCLMNSEPGILSAYQVGLEEVPHPKRQLQHDKSQPRWPQHGPIVHVLPEWDASLECLAQPVAPNSSIQHSTANFSKA